MSQETRNHYLIFTQQGETLALRHIHADTSYDAHVAVMRFLEPGEVVIQVIDAMDYLIEGCSVTTLDVRIRKNK